MKTYDLIIIGAGPAGYEAAFEAADLGMKTALVEKEALGGTCLNHGCIPTKALLYTADLVRRMREADSYGVTAGEALPDWARMQTRKRDVVRQLRSGIEADMKKKKIDWIRGTAACHGRGTVAVRTEAGEEWLRGERILVATGSRPVIPPIPGIGLPGVMTSDALLESERKPERLVIIGGGVIGVEFASLFQALGTAVTIVEALPRLLPNLDRELSQSVKMLLKKRGISSLTGARVQEIRRKTDGSLICACEGGDTPEIEADTVLVSIGRRPNTEGLFADGAAPDMDRGRILVDEHHETSVPGLYAAGDVTGGVMLAHAATAAARNAVRQMAGLPDCADLRHIPSCVYTEPEIACVGMSLEEAKDAGYAADSRKTLMTANGKTVLSGAERGYIRVVFDRESGKLLGALMMCERASDMISEFTQALSLGLTIRDMERVIRPHPTFSEAITGAVRTGRP